jgi:hypothetical protein
VIRFEVPDNGFYGRSPTKRFAQFPLFILTESLVVERLGDLNDCPLDFFFTSVTSVAGNGFGTLCREYEYFPEKSTLYRPRLSDDENVPTPTIRMELRV